MKISSSRMMHREEEKEEEGGAHALATASNVAGRERSKTGEQKGQKWERVSMRKQRNQKQATRTDDGCDGILVVDSSHLAEPLVASDVLEAGMQNQGGCHWLSFERGGEVPTAAADQKEGREGGRGGEGGETCELDDGLEGRLKRARLVGLGTCKLMVVLSSHCTCLTAKSGAAQRAGQSKAEQRVLRREQERRERGEESKRTNANGELVVGGEVALAVSVRGRRGRLLSSSFEEKKLIQISTHTHTHLLMMEVLPTA